MSKFKVKIHKMQYYPDKNDYEQTATVYLSSALFEYDFMKPYEKEFLKGLKDIDILRAFCVYCEIPAQSLDDSSIVYSVSITYRHSNPGFLNKKLKDTVVDFAEQAKTLLQKFQAHRDTIFTINEKYGYEEFEIE